MELGIHGSSGYERSGMGWLGEGSLLFCQPVRQISSSGIIYCFDRSRLRLSTVERLFILVTALLYGGRIINAIVDPALHASRRTTTNKD